VVPIRVPPLRERADDIPRLVHHFVRRSAETLGIPAPAVAAETLHFLQSYPWPGNVRELSNAIERALILARDPVLTPAAFADHLDPAETSPYPAVPGPTTTSPAPAEDLRLDLDELERRAIVRALSTTGGNRSRAAKLLGISERTLRNKLRAERNIPPG
ncbi:MAG TPA: helix-turn-helix domain-containing protein, partial [Gemmatimonadales bacterium]|nr:helix-turn-helix domain-containing protein [Gemmatimonadales bacterium]